MSAREDYPAPPRRGSRAGSGAALTKTIDGWAEQREAMCDEVDRLRAACVVAQQDADRLAELIGKKLFHYEGERVSWVDPALAAHLSAVAAREETP